MNETKGKLVVYSGIALALVCVFVGLFSDHRFMMGGVGVFGLYAGIAEFVRKPELYKDYIPMSLKFTVRWIFSIVLLVVLLSAFGAFRDNGLHQPTGSVLLFGAAVLFGLVIFVLYLNRLFYDGRLFKHG